MKFLYAFLILSVCCWSCGQPEVKTVRTRSNDFTALLDSYYEDRLKLFPVEGTMVGDNRYNSQLPNDVIAKYSKFLMHKSLKLAL